MIDLQQARQYLRDAVATQGEDFVYLEDRDAVCFYVPVTDEMWDQVREHSDAYDWSDKLDTPPSADSPQRQTGCLIGVALDLAGVTLHHDLSNTTAIDAYHPLAGNANLEYVRGIRTVLTEEALSYFGTAQRSQDNGSSWRVAYEVAESTLNSNDRT